MTDRPDIPEPDDDLLAAELALRLLTGADLRAARRRAETDPAFAARVVAWEAELAAMAEAGLEPEAPDPALRRRLDARLFPGAPNAAPRPAWGLRLWQGLAFGALALAAGLALLTLERPSSGPLYAAEIAAEAGDFRVVALVDMAGETVVLTRTEGAAPPGRILQVWAHGPGEPAQSVGLWPEGATVRLPLPQEIAAVEGVLTLGVSEEPPGGSTTGAPSGRVFGTVDIPGVAPVP